MFISAPGLACPIGLDADSACAAMRAGIAQFEELPYRSSSGEPVIGASVPGFDSGQSRARRLLDLLATAVRETLDKAPSLPVESIPVIVCLAEPGRPGGHATLAPHIVGGLERSLNVSFHGGRSGAIAKGHVSGFRALRAAQGILRDRDVPACLICGVDSYLNGQSLYWLDQNQRLKNEENSDGVIPGEAAAAFLVSDEPLAGSEPMMRVAGIGFGREPSDVHSEDPLLGEGMSGAVRSAIGEAGLQLHEFQFRLSDVTGESYGFRELALTEARLLRVRTEDFPIWHWAEAIGDVGAASALCQFLLAGHSFVNGYAPGQRAVCHGAAVNGDRAAAAVQAAA